MALGDCSPECCSGEPMAMAEELIREISVLEREVMQLERYLLSLYRAAYSQQQPSFFFPETEEEMPKLKEAPLVGSAVRRTRSDLSQRASRSAIASVRTWPCLPSPPSWVEKGANGAASQVVSLAEYLGARIADHVPRTPNRVSEDMVRCISAVYFKLSPPAGDGGPFDAFIPVASLRTEELHKVHPLLQTFSSLLARLDQADPRKMKHEEKLAFWINVHNALVMQAHLECRRAPAKRITASSLLKVACNVGGRVITVETIRSCILRHRAGQQRIRALLSPKLKLRGRDGGDGGDGYATERAEPLLHFALCTGCQSDPVVRIYSPRRVYRMLETAKEEYIRASVVVRDEKILLLPKLLEAYARESNLEIVVLVESHLPETLRRSREGRSRRDCIQWVNPNPSFGYLLPRELSGPLLL